ncbi:MAG TPA: nitrous oxide-stimulated promoter family protein [Desulfobacteraceae bacterium]|nr:nitrous oxide-stimulated promoter family protein [Desulfobacteraceae bacterium]
MSFGKRMQREADTVAVMIRRYCRDKHSPNGDLCAECRELLEYAHKRLSLCPFQENKTTCGKCAVHCYKPAMRGRIREVMRYVGPRLLLTNPLLSIQHTLDGLRKAPSTAGKREKK